MTTIFSVEGSLVDLNQQSVPNFSRPSPVNLERIVDDSLQLYPIATYHPGIYYENGAFLLEPECANLVTWNLDLTKSVWLKGSNVIIRADYAPAPDSSYLADRITWSSGSGNSQALRRTFVLEGGTTYTLSAILSPQGGVFGPEDFMQLTTGVVGTPKVGLSTLNAKPNCYQLLETQFTTLGKQPTYPGSIHEVYSYPITAVTASTVIVTLPAGLSVAADAWQGGQLLINNALYLITTNTAIAGNSVVVTLDTTALVTNGVTTAMTAVLREAPTQTVTLEFYCVNTASLNNGGIQIERRKFRTSMVYQDDEIELRAASLLTYRKSPIQGLKTFGFYGELIEWRGDGRLFDFGNLVGTITNGKLVVTADAVTINLIDDLPTENLKFYVQAQEANSTIAIYVNGVLKNRTTINNFRANQTASMVLHSTGLRAWQRMVITDTTRLEGQVSVGDNAREEVKTLFDSRVLIDSVAISSHAPLINLAPVTVPAPPSPIAQSRIVGLNTGTNVASVSSATGFVNGTDVIIKRGDYTVLKTRITGIAGNDITLAASYNALIGDTLVYGEIDVPGTASVRFPFDPVDPQTILAIDVGLKRLTVGSVLSYTKTRAFVRSPLYQEIAEVLVTDIDVTNNYLFVSDMTGIAVDQIISQPLNELLIDPDNYFAMLIDPIPGVNVHATAGKYQNALVLENTNKTPVKVTAALRVYM